MLEMEETKITPPRNPLTLMLNGAIMDYYFDYFMKKYLPQYDTKVTSKFRDASHNASIGGAENSAHLHSLAVDFILLKKGTDKPVSQAESKNIFQTVIAPKWSGYSKWESDHIHVNLSRKIGTAAGMLTLAVMGIVGITMFKNWKGRKDGKRN